ncbi:MAG: putative iron-sulfur cluster-binding metallochaperone [Pyrinomonadaceae bacterium]
MEGRGRETATSLPAKGAFGSRKTPTLRERAACMEASHPVSRKTVMLMLKPEFFDRVGAAEYRFCLLPDCDIVYFDGGEGPCFTTEHVRVRVGLKERDDPVPLCYCFGFCERDIREEVERTGETTVPQRIRALIKNGMCACPARNPSGVCCLGEVNQTTKNLMREGVRGRSDCEGNK